ncbi:MULTISPECIES: LutC/YkgG family protein [Rufibacter]|uniref:L-lactate dehydrogenase complex protein LldG n=1 Tax=Rufibacter quisquiliarum TaxID=1549639 RepID=A0A839GDD7_9BACT|nr:MULTISPECIES: lactate utilization protein [Rufibacter]MBA9076922.1 L-lactate dehydrogenase complex protein LldG [Rufibacter quisquiliarum]
MYEAKSKEIVLRKVREALAKSAPFLPPTPDFSTSVYGPLLEDLSVQFAEAFIRNSGTFVYCENEEDFFDQLFEFKKERGLDNLYVWEPALKKILHAGGIHFNGTEEDFLGAAEAALTTCEALVARTGSLLVSSANASGRRLSVYPAMHLVVAKLSQLVPDIKQALAFVQQKYDKRLPSMISLVSGPSRTADIEKTLVMGAHGPKELILFLIDDHTD